MKYEKQQYMVNGWKPVKICSKVFLLEVLNIHFYVAAFTGIQLSLYEKGKKTNHFNPYEFCTPWKRQKTLGFLTFPGGKEMEHRTKVGKN